MNDIISYETWKENGYIIHEDGKVLVKMRQGFVYLGPIFRVNKYAIASLLTQIFREKFQDE